MTPNREDYLKLIFELGGEKRLVANKQIIENIQVSGASVSEMVSKLVKEELAQHVPYQGVRLTEKGWKLASSLIRKHRLWEVFLIEKLKYPLEEIHMEAELLEHATSDTLAGRLSVFLNHPKTCPHGGVIPEGDELISEVRMHSLAEFEAGDLIRILRVLDDPDSLQAFIDSGIVLKETYVITEKSDNEMTLFWEEKQQTVVLSSSVMTSIFVEKLGLSE